MDKRVEALKLLIQALHETIVETPEGCPAGVLYAALNAHGVDLDMFTRLMQGMVDSGMIRKEGQCYYAAARH